MTSYGWSVYVFQFHCTLETVQFANHMQSHMKIMLLLCNDIAGVGLITDTI